MLLRHFVPKRIRWFYEGCLPVRGQLWYADRKLLYETIHAHKPKIVFEVGTWYGGGSTYFISQALYENGSGVLHTIEVDLEIYSVAVENYRRHLAHLLPYVEFHFGDSTTVYPDLLRELEMVDAVFLDGAANPQQTRSELEMFAPYLTSGSLLLAHDWDNEKMSWLRPFIEASPDWVIKHTISLPYSVGFAVCMLK